MRHFTTSQLQEMQNIATIWRKNKITMQEYHNRIGKYYN